jgi:hypothetical protein
VLIFIQWEKLQMIEEEEEEKISFEFPRSSKSIEMESPFNSSHVSINEMVIEEEDFDFKWGLQVRIWSFVLLILCFVSIPFVFIGGRPIVKENSANSIQFFFGFNWEPCVMFILSFPTSLFGLLSSAFKKTIFTKLVEIHFNLPVSTSLD